MVVADAAFVSCCAARHLDATKQPRRRQGVEHVIRGLHGDATGPGAHCRGDLGRGEVAAIGEHLENRDPGSRHPQVVVAQEFDGRCHVARLPPRFD